MTPDEMRALIKATIEETLAAHTCTQFSPEQVAALKDVADVGTRVKKGVIYFISIGIIGAMATAIIAVSKANWTWWKG